MMIGFGSTETHVEEALESAFTEYVKHRYATHPVCCFTDEFIKDAEGWLDDKGEQSRAIAKTYDEHPDHPDRYSYFYPHVTSSASAIVALVTFHHINRRHGLSPDGWALMKTERTIIIWERDCPRKAAA